MKKINKFLKLAVLFTGLPLLICVFIRSDAYQSFYSKWIPSFKIIGFDIVELIILGFIITAIIFGIISIIKSHKTEKRLAEIMMIFLTLLNIYMLVICIITLAGYSITFLSQ